MRALAASALLLASVGAAAEPRGPVTDHFDGERFFNPGEPFDKDWRDLWRYWREREPGTWTRKLDAPRQPSPPAQVGAGALRVSVIGHASVLIQADGLNLLTDPIWSERASPVSFAGPRRFTPPGLAFAQLPKIDVVLISHDHYDHLDLPTLVRLREMHDPVFLVGLGQAPLLREAGITPVMERDWWQGWRMPNGCAVFGAQARHWTGRGIGDRNRSLWMSWIVQTRGGPVYFAGDTGYGAQFTAAHRRFGAMRLALLPIGAYKPRWLTEYQHMDPAQAVQAHLDLRAQQSLGVHFGTFELSDEGQLEPVNDLAQARRLRGVAESAFTAPEFGAGYDVPAVRTSPEINSGCKP